MDYRKLGFKAGLEVHQQLDTHKLFCKCPSVLTDEFDYSFERELVPTRSELGGMDKAALAEAGKKKRFIYMASSLSTCLVEADEEPPHEANQEAIDICLEAALMLNAKIVDELHFMRKIVIDGSTTSGFQRTALVALGGKVGKISIETICLEEDAARRIGEEGNAVKYALDRLGIPLVEITTAPEIESPEEAEEVALAIGKILRATKKVKRGIGTIRQDLNVSIKGGSRVEIKGVQELRNISRILKNEVERQLEMAEVKKLLRQRTTKDEIEKAEIVDVSSIFANTKSEVIRKGKGTVMAARLPGFEGLIGGVRDKKNRLGKEFAAAAEAAGGGIMHSDELPNYGISEEEVEMVREKIGCRNMDAFVISSGEKKVARTCIEAVITRAAMAFDMEGEVRKALPDGTTKYMRPIAGAERMYPETDVPPVFIEPDRIKRLKSELPETFDDKILRYEKYGLGKDEAEQIVYGGKDELFEPLVKKHDPKAIARILLHVLPEIERKGHDIKNLAGRIDEVLEGLEKGMFSKDGIDKIMECWAGKPDASLEEIIKECGIEAMNKEDLRKEIKSILKEHASIVAEKGEDAISPLMGIAMKKMKGKADGSLIYQILKEEVMRIVQEKGREYKK
ncbi:MAG: Glu-tRNA(Gln) amidotransferase GatDE subunit E [Thermoplasmata archaeon]|nr:MAG: Glu-tRNA(Gln) amidotransferase GatDE subunit E [Thermoplasmata archaeon]